LKVFFDCCFDHKVLYGGLYISAYAWNFIFIVCSTSGDDPKRKNTIVLFEEPFLPKKSVYPSGNGVLVSLLNQTSGIPSARSKLLFDN